MCDDGKPDGGSGPKQQQGQNTEDQVRGQTGGSAGNQPGSQAASQACAPAPAANPGQYGQGHGPVQGQFAPPQGVGIAPGPAEPGAQAGAQPWGPVGPQSWPPHPQGMAPGYGYPPPAFDPNAAGVYGPGYGPGNAPGYPPGYGPGYGPGYAPGYGTGYGPGYAPGYAAPMFHGMPTPGGYAPAATGHGAGHGQGQGQGAAGAGLGELMEELKNGGTGMSSITRMLSLDDKEMWKGALIGAAAVLLLTNESLQNSLFKGSVRARDAVASGVDRVRSKVRPADAGEAGDE